VDPASDTLFVADTANSRIRFLSPPPATPLLSTFAGGVSGSASGDVRFATFTTPRGAAFSAVSGALYLSDATATVRRVTCPGGAPPSPSPSPSAGSSATGTPSPPPASGGFKLRQAAAARRGVTVTAATSRRSNMLPPTLPYRIRES
jgi:hypothetical protein